MEFHEKYWAFIDHKAPVEFLEGTTASGKTVAAVFKFMLEVAESPRKLHIIASDTPADAAKNLIDSDAGILYQFGNLVDYKGNGSAQHGMAHLLFHAPGGDKVIFVLGYYDRVKWKKALGGQYGCVLIDEINTAQIDFVREAAMRCDYLLGTLNPDAPELPIYSDYINHSRPLPQYAADAPEELSAMLNETPNPGWVHWFFGFEHNVWLTEAKRQRIIGNVPAGTKLYNNKILGLRTRAEGLVYVNWEKAAFDIDELRRRPGIESAFGLDFGYTNDPSALFCGLVDPKAFEIYVFDEMYEKGLSNRAIANEITRMGYAKEHIVADRELKSVDDLYELGLHRVSASRKGPDSVNNGIQRIQDYKIIVHPKCAHFLTEISNYTWDKNKQGSQVNKPIGEFNHLMDAMRYALEDITGGYASYEFG